MLVHLTMTGYLAGRPYCNQQRNDHDLYTHPAYDQRVMDSILNNPNLCPKCKKVWNTTETVIDFIGNDPNVISIQRPGQKRRLYIPTRASMKRIINYLEP